MFVCSFFVFLHFYCISFPFLLKLTQSLLTLASDSSLPSGWNTNSINQPQQQLHLTSPCPTPLCLPTVCEDPSLSALHRRPMPNLIPALPNRHCPSTAALLPVPVTAQWGLNPTPFSPAALVWTPHL